MTKLSIFTDFDNALVSKNTPILFSEKYCEENPFKFVHSIIILLSKRKKLGGKALSFLMNSAGKKKKELWCREIARGLKFNEKWLKKFKQIVGKKKTDEVEIIIITRNEAIIPELFMRDKENLEVLRKASGSKFKSNYTIIGNKTFREHVIEHFGKIKNVKGNLNEIRDKEKIIPNRAYYFGDEKEKSIFRKNHKLKEINFVEV